MTQERERDAFEARFPMPAQCIRCGDDGYAATGYNAWDANKFIAMWEGWQARAALSQPQSQAHGEAVAPIDMMLYCPACGTQHIDAAEGHWTNPPHRSHLCHCCGHIWRPADVPTNGVTAIATKGKADGPVVVAPVAAQQGLSDEEIETIFYPSGGADYLQLQIARNIGRAMESAVLKNAARDLTDEQIKEIAKKADCKWLFGEYTLSMTAFARAILSRSAPQQDDLRAMLAESEEENVRLRRRLHDAGLMDGSAPQLPAAGDGLNANVRTLLEQCRDFIDATKTPAYPAGVDLADAIDALLAAPAAAPAPYKDSTPHLHVGDSSFEGWFENYNPAGNGDKQRARDAYAAGMGDPLVVAASTQQSEPSAVHEDVYCALQYVEGSLAAIANRRELQGDVIRTIDTIGAASKRAKAALNRLQAVAHHLDVAAPSADSAAVLPVELAGVKEALEEGGGRWATCTGCYDTEDGRPTAKYPYSEVFSCDLGSGCSECGGIGAVWDDTDYAEMGAFMEQRDSAAEVDSAAARDAELNAELDWCITEGCSGPRTLKALQRARAALAAQREGGM